MMTDAWVVTGGGGQVTAYEHGCQAADAAFALTPVRIMGAMEYAK